MAIFLILLSLILLTSICYQYYQGSKLKIPPGPTPWPIIGNFGILKPVRFRSFAELSRVYGPIISVWSGSTLEVVVSSSKLAKEVLKDNDQNLANRHRNRSTSALTNHHMGLIWTDYGPNYVKHRKVCTLHLFSPKSLDASRHIRESEVMVMVVSIFNDITSHEKHAKSIILRTYLFPMAYNTMARLVLGRRFICKDGVMSKQGVDFLSIIMEKMKLGGSAVELAEHFSWLKWTLWFTEKAHLDLEKRRACLIRAIMKGHRLGLQNDSKKHDFMDALLGPLEKNEISEGNKIGLLRDLITAGMDTTATSIEWAMAQVIKNPRVQQKAQEELDRVIGTDRILSEKDLSNLPYLQCVTKEALRMHPPTPLMLPHRANVDTNIGGYDIPKGTNVHVNVWAIARDPSVWRDPHEFKPERFLDEDVDAKGHDFRLLPFGAGRRVCPAAQLGMNMVMLALGQLLHHFDWGASGDEIDMTETPGLVTVMRTPLVLVPTLRLHGKKYNHFNDLI